MTRVFPDYTADPARHRHEVRWEPYTPTWAATITAPALGNGTLQAAFARAGNIVYIRGHLAAGSTTTFGSGGWTFTLPQGHPYITSGTPDIDGPLGPARIVDDDTGDVYLGDVMPSTSTRIFLATPKAAFNDVLQVGGTNPIVWASGDTARWSAWYPTG